MSRPAPARHGLPWLVAAALAGLGACTAVVDAALSDKPGESELGGGGSGAPGGGGATSTTTAQGGTGGAGGQVTVACGQVTCDSPTFCCWDTMGGSSCVKTRAECGDGVPMTCDGPEDCVGVEVCCAHGTLNQKLELVATDVTCASSCTLLQGGVHMCHPDQDPLCPPGQQCNPLADRPEYGVCL